MRLNQFILAGGLAIGLAVLTTQAQAVGNLIDVAVYDRAENRTLPVYFHGGRYYVVGKPGNEYQVTIRNRQSDDVMTVVSVDGVNAVSGETAHWSQTGYVFGAGASYAISGWRKSLQRVARFYFTELENSYAARSGRPDNVGVIGVAVFRRKAEPAVSLGRLTEQRREMHCPESARADASAADAATGNAAESAGRQPATSPPLPVEKSLGTGHGVSEHAPVRYTNFERASSAPDEVISIYYDSYRNLQAQGVIRSPGIARPAPFLGQFVPDIN